VWDTSRRFTPRLGPHFKEMGAIPYSSGCGFGKTGSLSVLVGVLLLNWARLDTYPALQGNVEAKSPCRGYATAARERPMKPFQGVPLGTSLLCATRKVSVLLRNIFALRVAQSLGVPLHGTTLCFALRAKSRCCYATSLLCATRKVSVLLRNIFALRVAQSLGVATQHLCFARSAKSRFRGWC
jgi:hypothetical protein